MRALIVMTFGAIVVGGVFGVGAGYKIEQNRVASDVKRLQHELAVGTPATTPKKGVANKTALGNERVGTVTTVSADTVDVATKRLGVLQLHLIGTTRIAEAVVGSKAEIKVGERVLIPIGGRDVLILPSGSMIGQAVTSVASGSFSVAKATGTGSVTVPFAKVKLIDTTVSRGRSGVVKGEKVIAAGRTVAKGNFVVVEVVVVPAGSAFAN